MSTQAKKELLADLKEQGYHFEVLGSWPAKTTYYKPNGEALPNLPADPYSMRRYLRRGLQLAPPVTPSNGESLTCSLCGFEAKSEFGLRAHERSHAKKRKRE